MSEYDLEQEIPQCVRKNIDIKGYDIVDPKNLPTKSLRKCQELCQLTLGCQYFSWSKVPIKQCFLKLREAVASWNEEATTPNLNVYSGPANCGKKCLSFEATKVAPCQ